MTVTVLATAESRYPVNRKLLREVAARTVKMGDKIKANKVELSVAVVGDRKMKELSRRYRGLDKTTDVLSFTFEEAKEGSGLGPDGVLRLGEVVVSFPQVRAQAVKRSKLLDEIMAELVEHGVLHLMGKHHKE